MVNFIVASKEEKKTFLTILLHVVGKVHSASVVLNIPDLEKVAAKRKRAMRRLEKR